MKEMIGMRHLTRGGTRISAVLVAVAMLAWASPARADVPGFEVKVGQAPRTFTIGKDAGTLTAVASTDRGRRCLKVRWALTIETKGISLDQIRVTRVENNQSFPVRAGVEDETATVVDERLDPGQLCQGRTVTGRWDVAFTGPDDGEVTFRAQAFDAAGRLLSSTGTESQVVSPVAAEPSESPSPSPSAVPTQDIEVEEEDPVEEQAAGAEPAPSDQALTPASSSSNVLGVGLIVGALMVFLGVGMLLRLRLRNRRQPAWQTETQAMPTGFESMPRRRN
ncbi:hypothetical protein Aab01nite_46090 [Paractinoplanes abujensis]|uniref:Uncharacterized protein n=1 Tax=Paractinoplanes abujensis TaxID=882441 RepID=A0A7W7CKJ0_9ACTN|nr:hypothetical protein [Actinoplanes abujensis]MBB4690256.1 hypothetical protein [Actinoplanes abujensis]GID21019.1 hypothetical protein Aab01nite_46090 [Actinoplanes abujensis]